MKFFLFLLLLLFIFNKVNSQNETDIWYFGRNAGIDFSTGEPRVLTDGKLSTTEGVASVCDNNGKLLFYTDGITVWNSYHNVIKNGTALMGHPSSTQSGVAVTMPKNDSLYYLFTISNEANPGGFRYSVINVKGDSGNCEVLEKNILIATPVTEKITAVAHRNGQDYWILAHRWNSYEFMAYKLTKNGLDTNYISSKIGSIHSGDVNNTIGYMKTSPDGSQLAVAVKNINLVELFDFDNSNGKISNCLTFQMPEDTYPYGVEFSPNGSLLYISAGKGKKVYQFNLQAGSPDAVLNSGIVVAELAYWTGALQLAKDRKLYVSPHTSKYLDVINYPDSIGKACMYEKDKIYLQGNACALGFPTFLQSYFVTKDFQEEINYFSSSKIEMGKPLILKNILFETAKSTLLPKSYIELNKLLDVLNQNPNYIITISGHTDNVGNKSYNLNLSQNRSKSVANYLISKGIAADRITTSGYGNSRPVATNETDEGRQLNRRVEFIMNSR